MLSTKTVQVLCPSCNKPTKILGRVDICMHCNEPLTLDKNLEGKDFNEKYNQKNMKLNNRCVSEQISFFHPTCAICYRLL